MYTMACVLFLPMLWFVLVVCGVLFTGLLVCARSYRSKAIAKPYVLPSDGLSSDAPPDDEDCYISGHQHATNYQPFWKTFSLRRIPGILSSKNDFGNEEDLAVELRENGPQILKEGLKDKRDPEAILTFDDVPAASERY